MPTLTPCLSSSDASNIFCSTQLLPETQEHLQDTFDELRIQTRNILIVNFTSRMAVNTILWLELLAFETSNRWFKKTNKNPVSRTAPSHLAQLDARLFIGREACACSSVQVTEAGKWSER